MLDVIRGGIDSALLGMGKRSVHDLGRDDVLVPDGFLRTLGAETALAESSRTS